MTIAITPHPEGCLIAVRAQPGAKRNAVLGEAVAESVYRLARVSSPLAPRAEGRSRLG
jgi:hypothetical protein